jgi:hypothetical protein
VPLTVSGAIDPSSLSGQSTTSNVTNTNLPDFNGPATDGSLLTLYAMPTSGGTTIEIGSGYAGDDRSWYIDSSTALPDGSYPITAIDPYAGATSLPVAITPDPLVVASAQSTTTTLPPADGSAPSTSILPPADDAAGPVISALTLDRPDATLTVTFQDGSSGMDLATVKDKAFYHLSAGPLSKEADVQPMIRPTRINIIRGAAPTSPVVAKVVFQHGARLRGGVYSLVIDSGTRDTGIEDEARKALSGTFDGTFPSGVGRRHGDFVAFIATRNNGAEQVVPSKGGAHDKLMELLLHEADTKA